MTKIAKYPKNMNCCNNKSHSGAVMKELTVLKHKLYKEHKSCATRFVQKKGEEEEFMSKSKIYFHQ